MAVVKQRALDRYFDNLTGEGELESLRCREIRSSSKVQVVAIEVKF